MIGTLHAEPLPVLAALFAAIDQMRAEARAAKLRAKKHRGRRNKHAAREVALREALAIIAAALPEEETPANGEVGGRQASEVIAAQNVSPEDHHGGQAGEEKPQDSAGKVGADGDQVNAKGAA